MQNNILNNDFKKWVSQISKKYKQAQIKAAISINSEMLKFYLNLEKKQPGNPGRKLYIFPPALPRKP